MGNIPNIRKLHLSKCCCCSCCCCCYWLDEATTTKHRKIPCKHETFHIKSNQIRANRMNAVVVSFFIDFLTKRHYLVLCVHNVCVFELNEFRKAAKFRVCSPSIPSGFNWMAEILKPIQTTNTIKSILFTLECYCCRTFMFKRVFFLGCFVEFYNYYR